MGQRAIRSWISRHSYHSAGQIVKNKKLDHRVYTSSVSVDCCRVMTMTRYRKISFVVQCWWEAGLARDFCVTQPHTHSILVLLRSYHMSGQTVATGGS